MVRKYFGTDGIRGLANGDKLTPELALRVGMAAGHKFFQLSESEVSQDNTLVAWADENHDAIRQARRRSSAAS